MEMSTKPILKWSPGDFRPAFNGRHHRVWQGGAAVHPPQGNVNAPRFASPPPPRPPWLTSADDDPAPLGNRPVD